MTVGRRVIERGFNGTDALTIHAAGLRFRCTAAFPAGTSTAYLKSFSAHKMQPPPCWPKPPPTPFNCSVFEPPCTCKGMADYYGVAERLGGMGCAPQAAIDWWTKDKVPQTLRYFLFFWPGCFRVPSPILRAPRCTTYPG